MVAAEEQWCKLSATNNLHARAGCAYGAEAFLAADWGTQTKEVGNDGQAKFGGLNHAQLKELYNFSKNQRKVWSESTLWFLMHAISI